MEEIFRLQPEIPLTIEIIQDILSQQVSLKYSVEPRDKADAFNNYSEREGLTSEELKNFAIGLGLEVPAEITRVMLLLLADFFAKNPLPLNSKIISRILEFYEFEILPQVFSQGLAVSPTAHLLMPVFGQGKVYFQNYLLNAADVHDIFSWQINSWPEKLPATLPQASFLGWGSLVYNFIQFKKLFSYYQILLPESPNLSSTEKLFPAQIEHLQSQLNEALAYPQTQQKHLSGLTCQLEKLLAKFGEHITESFSENRNNNSTLFTLNENLSVKAEYLLALLQTLSEENLIMYESGFDTNSGPSTNFIRHFWLQPYQILKNLEHILALATILQLTTTDSLKKNINSEENLRAVYRNQVIDVLKETVFAELIRKTISFIYARVTTNL
ncbi:hypothetical protein AHMF7605_02595 [Adhaeribacter arboris]|uniref:Uncharacterized protein n=1 Tax=Adhaeribacter arboris TaxID=2072846 RepID=A0A2T2YAF2_9BACT|nr:aromatic amino acid lyase [Adhaeribacter arboris]PSR52489.1 hypothetical protein AHMF7605_02595 [Adhaeribacter arboris]